MGIFAVWSSAVGGLDHTSPGGGQNGRGGGCPDPPSSLACSRKCKKILLLEVLPPSLQTFCTFFDVWVFCHMTKKCSKNVQEFHKRRIWGFPSKINQGFPINFALRLLATELKSFLATHIFEVGGAAAPPSMLGGGQSAPQASHISLAAGHPPPGSPPLAPSATLTPHPGGTPGWG